tara:strand:- start:722 stop:1051 length:330 start_codon:yes stop_codon:yes gene_type:complete
MNKIKKAATKLFNPKQWSSKKRTRRRNFTYISGKDIKGPYGIKLRYDSGKKTYVNPIILLPYLAYKNYKKNKKTKKQKGGRRKTRKKMMKRSNKRRVRKKSRRKIYKKE